MIHKELLQQIWKDFQKLKIYIYINKEMGKQAIKVNKQFTEQGKEKSHTRKKI